MIKRLAAVLLLVSFPAFAQPEAGRDYLPIEPPLQPKKKIELIEFFYYGCPQCLDLEPFLQAWREKHGDVGLVRIPAFRSAWLPLARTYYSLEIMGQEKKLRSRIFSALQVQNIDLNDESTLFDWMGRQDINIRKFKSIYFSDEVARKIGDSAELAERLGITGVPSLIVGGRYLVLGDLTREDLLEELVDMAGKP